MSVSLTKERVLSLKHIIKETLAMKHLTIRDLAKIIGKLVAAFPGCLYGPLHYRCLELDKTIALNKENGNFDALITMSDVARHC